MRIKILALLLAFSFNALGQSALKKAESLIEKRQYLSAFETLEKADPKNQNADILYLKTEIVLKYFARSKNHQIFALHDLAENEDLLELRTQNEGTYSMQIFQADSLIKNLLKDEPDNFKLHYILGRYYQEVYMKYGESPNMPETVLLKHMEMHFGIAYKNGIKKPMAAYGIGFYHLMQDDFSSAIPYLKDCTKLDPDYVPAHYNLAYAYLQLNRRSESIQSAKKAFALYEDQTLKADAARMIALSYAELDSLEQALVYYRHSDTLNPQNFYTLKTLMQLEIVLDSLSSPSTRLRFYELAPDKPSIYQELMNVHAANGMEQELLSFYQEQLREGPKDSLQFANLNLFSAVLQKVLKQEEDWPISLARARKSFKEIYPADHQVFVFMQSYFKEEH